MVEAFSKLAESHINISYAYCTTGAPGGRTLGIFKVNNIEKALKLAESKKLPRNEKRVTTKPPAGFNR
jgi:hypothetical protein